MSKDYLKLRWGDWILKDGFLSLPNTLIEHFEELNISQSELIFLQKILKHKSGYVIHDEQLWPNKSTSSLKSYRKSLKNKGLINYHIKKKSIDDKGYVTIGIQYDTSKLITKLEKKFYEQKSKSCPEEDKNLSLDNQKPDTLNNTNYNTIYYSGEINNKVDTEAENRRNNLHTNFIDTYKKIYLDTYGLQYNFTDKLIDTIHSTNSTHISTITKHLNYWFEFIEKFNIQNNQKLDASPYLLIKGGQLLNKFIEYAEEQEKLNNIDFTIFEDDFKNRNVIIPSTNYRVQLFIKKAYQILSHKKFIEKQREKDLDKDFEYRDKIREIYDFLRKNDDYLEGDFEEQIRLKDYFGHFYETPDFNLYLDHIKKNLDTIKNTGLDKTSYEFLYPLSLFMKNLFTKQEFYTLFNKDKDDYDLAYKIQRRKADNILEEIKDFKLKQKEELDKDWEKLLKEEEEYG